MIFLYWLISSLIAGLLYLGVFLIQKKKGKEIVKVWNLLAGFILTLILSVFLVFKHTRLNVFYTISFISFVDLLFVFLNPWKLISNNKINIKKGILILFSLFFISSEVFVSNAKAFQTYGEESSIDLTSLTTNGTVTDGAIEIKKTTVVSFQSESDFNSVEFVFSDFSDSTTIKITVSDAGTNVGTFSTNAVIESANIFVYSFTKEHIYSFTFAVDEGRYEYSSTGKLVEIRTNVQTPLKAHFIRPLTFILISVLLIYSKDIVQKLKAKSPAKLPYFIFGGLAILGTIIVFIVSRIKGGSYWFEYPLTFEQQQAKTTDIYVMLFDALKKGQFHLDIVPSDGLLNTQEPWVTPRQFSYLWDHAFYNGNYYCYYGILPVLLFSFPFYWFTGKVLTAYALQFFGLALYIPALLLVIHEIYLLVNRGKINYFVYGFMSLVAIVTSMTFMIATYEDGVCHEAVYHAPIILGLAMMDLFLAFVIIAYKAKIKNKGVLLGISGIFYVFVIMSRPSLFFIVLVALPLYLGMLFEKDVKLKQKVISFAPMIGILALGAIFICYYNYARFDSIVEFGQSYQLTVADQRNLTYSQNKLYASFVHFFLQTPKFYDTFPYISCSVTKLTFDDCPYVNGYCGILLIPMFLISFINPFLIRDDDKKGFKGMLFMFPILYFILAFTTYSKAGICARYLIELYHVATLGSIIGILMILDKTSKDGCLNNKAVIGLTFVCLISVFMTLNLSFDSFDGMMAGDAHGLRIYFSELFKLI